MEKLKTGESKHKGRMTTKEFIVRHAASQLLPWMHVSSDGKVRKSFYLKRPLKVPLMAAIDGATHIVPFVSERQFVSLFSRNINDMPYPESREFTTSLLQLAKRLLSSPEHKKMAARMIKNFVRWQFDMPERRYAFRDKYGFPPPGLIVISP